MAFFIYCKFFVKSLFFFTSVSCPPFFWLVFVWNVIFIHLISMYLCLYIKSEFLIHSISYRSFGVFLVGLSLNSGLCTCKTGALPLEPHLQSILLWLFWSWGSCDLFAQAGLKPLSSQSQPSNEDYRGEPLVPSHKL
jgi:hypothetical protein